MIDGTDFRMILGRRPKVVIGHPFLCRGGSESKVMWIAEALKPDCDVTVLTTAGWDLGELNAFYGTRLSAGDVKTRFVPLPRLMNRFTAAALRGSLYDRFACRIAHEYDIRISAYNLTDWGLPGIHFVCDFGWDPRIRAALHPSAPGLVYRDTLLRRLYLWAAGKCAAHSGRDVFACDLVIANSCWTAKHLKALHGTSAPVVYPPVWAAFPQGNATVRQIRFAWLGRVAQEKRIESVVSILLALRNRGHDLQLHLCGTIESNGYGRAVSKLCTEHSSWIIAHGRVMGDRKAQILTSCNFGISACQGEAFGVATAEMIKAGAIVFAPAEGGQAEILASPNLTFTSHDDAVEKIESVLLKPGLQDQLREHLRKQASRFGSEAFMRDIRAQIASFLTRSVAREY